MYVCWHRLNLAVIEGYGPSILSLLHCALLSDRPSEESRDELFSFTSTSMCTWASYASLLSEAAEQGREWGPVRPHLSSIWLWETFHSSDRRALGSSTYPYYQEHYCGHYPFIAVFIKTWVREWIIICWHPLWCLQCSMQCRLPVYGRFQKCPLWCLWILVCHLGAYVPWVYEAVAKMQACPVRADVWWVCECVFWSNTATFSMILLVFQLRCSCLQKYVVRPKQGRLGDREMRFLDWHAVFPISSLRGLQVQWDELHYSSFLKPCSLPGLTWG